MAASAIGKRIPLAARGKKAISAAVNRYRTIAALLLLAFWVPISSHEILEQWGVIHTQASDPVDKHDDNHDAADGLCQLPAGTFQAQKFFASEVSFVASAFVAGLVGDYVWEQASFALVNPSPPDIPVGWQFSSRAALPVRAPSLIS